MRIFLLFHLLILAATTALMSLVSGLGTQMELMDSTAAAANALPFAVACAAALAVAGGLLFRWRWAAITALLYLGSLSVLIGVSAMFAGINGFHLLILAYLLAGFICAWHLKSGSNRPKPE